MNSLFTKVGLALAFSPRAKALLCEAKRLQQLFNAEILIIHAGRKTSENEGKINNLLSEVGMEQTKIKLSWKDGDPAEIVLEESHKHNVDLLIMGALEKENLLKSYVGSIARKIMRESKCSNLVLVNPSTNSKPFKSFFVSTDYSDESVNAIKTSFEFALLEKAKDFVIVKDIQLQGLISSILDTGSFNQAETARRKWLEEETEKLELFVNDLALSGMNIQYKCVYGKEGWEAGNLARLNKADLFVMTVPHKKLTIIDRFFRHEIEYAFEDLPTNLLVIR
jgi:nucleotide-binding universal stress UspA family protein